MAEQKRLIPQYSSNRLDSKLMGPYVDNLMQRAKDERKGFEKKWYDNNFFDDGYHFRYFSRTENKIVDQGKTASLYSPIRAIPKASRQIRGMSNLLISPDPVPVVYPEKVSSALSPPIEVTDPETGETRTEPNPEYLEALEEAKRIARLAGFWLEEEFKDQEILDKLAHMIILAAKHGTSYMQVWADAVHEKIRTEVYDAFDIFLVGTLNSIYQSPFIIKAKPRVIAEIKADERFDAEKTESIHPDNRYASSEIKEAYMKARHGGASNPDTVATIIEKEAFVKEYLNSDNRSRIQAQKNGGDILRERKDGDIVIRHTFVAGNIEVLDEYIDLPDYPFVEFRFEPGPIYQTPLIERFIPSNKSLDLILSRLERYTNTMVAGAWLRRAGESWEVTNTAGGQIIDYTGTRPEQLQIAPLPNFIFNVLELLGSLIEEQGVTTTTLGKIPPGVRAHAAIESLKESEYANLVIASRRLNKTVKTIAEKMLDIADKHFVELHEVYSGKTEPRYFEVIGATGLAKRKAAKIRTSANVIPLKKDYRVEIEVQTGMAYTKEAQKEAARSLGDYMIQLAQIGFLNPDVVRIYLEQVLKTFGFGATSEIMEAMEQFRAGGKLSEEQVGMVKVALAEVMRDLQEAGVLPTSEQRIRETKTGVAETIRDIQQGGGVEGGV